MSGIDRREFIRRGAPGAAALYASPGLAMPGETLRAGPAVHGSLPRVGAPKRIVVLGAGMAGLVAAHELREAGDDVVVLEARTRPGGRVHTLREPLSDGLYAEAGAARIPPGHHFEGMTTVSWDEDPHSRGAYSAMRPHQLTTFGRCIGTPEGRVYFSREHTSPWQGWIQSAIDSGLGAARMISDSP